MAVTGARRSASRRSATAATPTPTAKADARRRQSRGDARRQQILDVAVELFADKGYRGSGLAELADRVGMTHPGLLYYFGTKERLLREVVAERERIEAELRHDLDPATLSLDTLVDIARQNVETAMLTRLYVVLAAESLDDDDPLHDFFVDRYAGARARIARLLRHAASIGELRADLDAEQLSREILAMLMGLEAQWLMDPKAFDLAGAMEGYVDALRLRLTPEVAAPVGQVAGPSGPARRRLPRSRPAPA